MKTHWRKNIDPRYISGEDLQNGLILEKGLRPEMNVKIIGFEDKGTYDQEKRSEITKTGLLLFDLDKNIKVYKPLILNVINSVFCTSEFGSPFVDDWLEKPIVLYAKPDKRHIFVARLKKANPQKPILTKQHTAYAKVMEAVANGYTLAQIESKYNVSKEVWEDLQNGIA